MNQEFEKYYNILQERELTPEEINSCLSFCEAVTPKEVVEFFEKIIVLENCGSIMTNLTDGKYNKLTRSVLLEIMPEEELDDIVQKMSKTVEEYNKEHGKS